MDDRNIYSSFRQSIHFETLLQCCICQEPAYDLKFFDRCSHFACQACFTQIRPIQPYKIRCPLCRTLSSTTGKNIGIIDHIIGQAYPEFALQQKWKQSVDACLRRYRSTLRARWLTMYVVQRFNVDNHTKETELTTTACFLVIDDPRFIANDRVLTTLGVTVSELFYLCLALDQPNTHVRRIKNALTCCRREYETILEHYDDTEVQRALLDESPLSQKIIDRLSPRVLCEPLPKRPRRDTTEPIGDVPLVSPLQPIHALLGGVSSTDERRRALHYLLTTDPTIQDALVSIAYRMSQRILEQRQQPPQQSQSSETNSDNVDDDDDDDDDDDSDDDDDDERSDFTNSSSDIDDDYDEHVNLMRAIQESVSVPARRHNTHNVSMNDDDDDVDNDDNTTTVTTSESRRRQRSTSTDSIEDGEIIDAPYHDFFFRCGVLLVGYFGNIHDLLPILSSFPDATIRERIERIVLYFCDVTEDSIDTISKHPDALLSRCYSDHFEQHVESALRGLWSYKLFIRV